jgi:aminoglycoside 6'-N-acetyltransferase I
MEKLDLNNVADEFEMISNENMLFYNVETGDFKMYIDPIYSGDEDDIDTFDDDTWIAAPSQRDFREYDIMANFADTVTDPRKNELLSVALDGSGAFRRFKDTLHRVGLADEWYDFKHKAYMEIAREWCEENGIEYINSTEKPRQESFSLSEDKYPKDVIIIPLLQKMTEAAAEVLRDALSYSKSDAAGEIKRMLSSKRIALAAIVDNPVDASLQLVGIIGAIPQYGVTGWELHPLAVLKKYQGRGIGRLLVETLEREVVTRGGVMIYLGSDDETGTTSLYGVDLYDDTFSKLTTIQNIGGHSYTFYEKMGYKIVGVFPDANGIGKPDIWMAKRIKRRFL